MRARLLVVAVVLGSVLAGLGAGAAIAAFTARESNPQDLSAAGPPQPASKLVAQSRSNDAGASGSQIQFGLLVRNPGSERVDLKNVTMRYWYTGDGADTQQPNCYYAIFGCNKVRLDIIQLTNPLEGADHYLEVTFKNGKLDEGEVAELSQLAILNQAGGSFDQHDDYSFLNQSGFTDNPRVTVYIGGELTWGTEPDAVPADESFELQYKNRSGNPLDNAIEPTIKLNGTGNVLIDLRRVTIRYWFTKDSTSQSLVGVCNFAQIGCGEVSLSFAPVSPARPKADTYLEVRFSGGRIQVEGTTGEIQLRINKADYSNFDESNDYSWGANIALELNPRITAYLDGELIWGTPP